MRIELLTMLDSDELDWVGTFPSEHAALDFVLAEWSHETHTVLVMREERTRKPWAVVMPFGEQAFHVCRFDGSYEVVRW